MTLAIPVLTSARRPLARGLLRSPVAITSIAVLVLLVVGSVLAPLLAPYDPLQQNAAIASQGPSAAHVLGTDTLGRDLLSRLMYGGRETLAGVVEAVVIMLVIAVPVGVCAAYFRGAFDRAVLWVIDVVMSVPAILITLATLAIFRNSMVVAMAVVGVLASAAFARIFRSAVLAVRQEPFIDAALVMGLPHRLIILRHVLPHAVGTILVQTSLFAAAVLGIQTGLSYLAFGPPPPAPTWGGMVAEAQAVLVSFPWMFVPTGGVIAVATLALGLLGDALRDANAARFRHETARAPRTAAAAPASADATAEEIAPSEEAALSLRDVTVGFAGAGRGPGIDVVQNVTFDVAPGEIVGLVGESGSGKTVTALSVLGLLPAGGAVRSGSIRFGGTDLTADPGAAARVRGSGIAYVSQEPMVALDPSFRVGSQIAEVVRRHDRCSRRAAARRAKELLASVRIADPDRVARSFPHQISGGMAQRVVIARALAGRPRVLIADEPTTALDVTVQAEVLGLLESMRRETGLAIVLVTHDWGVVAETCDRAIVMYAGQVVEQAAVRDLIPAPRHPYSRALLRSNPHGARRGELLPSIPGSVPPPGSWPDGCRFAARCDLATDACRQAPIALERVDDTRTSRCIRIDALVASERAEAATATRTEAAR